MAEGVGFVPKIAIFCVADAVIRQAASGNSMSALPGISANLQKQLHAAASGAFASGFAMVGVVSAVLGCVACIAGEKP